MVFSASKIAKYNRCPRSYKLHYLDQQLPDDDADTSALDVGSMVHAGIESALRNSLRMDKSPLDYALETLSGWEFAYADVTTAREILTYYIPLLGIGDRLKPYVHGGLPLIEVQFMYTVPDTDYVLKGVIDAVCVNSKGETILIDWKTRSKFPQHIDVQLDMQLYIYAQVVKDLYNIRLDTAMQVQLLKDVPKEPSFTGKGEPSRTSGKMTKVQFYKALTEHGLNPADYHERFQDKIISPYDAMQVNEIDLSKTDMVWRDVMTSLDTITHDTAYRRVLSSYTCGFCNFKNSCLDNP